MRLFVLRNQLRIYPENGEDEAYIEEVLKLQMSGHSTTLKRRKDEDGPEESFYLVAFKREGTV